MTKILSTLPKGSNGLTALAAQMNREPERLHVVIALVDCSSRKIDTDTDETEPTVRILRVEAINRADKPAALTMFRDAIAKRTGATVLDGMDGFDQELESAFGSTS
jgi:hypothetical protein